MLQRRFFFSTHNLRKRYPPKDLRLYTLQSEGVIPFNLKKMFLQNYSRPA